MSMPRPLPMVALVLAVAAAGCGTTAEDRARVRAMPTPQAIATPTPVASAAPAIAADAAEGVVEVARLDAGTKPVTAVVWTPGGDVVIAGDEAGIVRRLPVDGGSAEPVGDDGEPIRAVAATGDRIAWGGEAGVIRAIGGTTGRGAARDVAEAPRGVFSLASTPAGVLAAGTGEGTVLVFGRERYQLEGLSRAVDGVAFAADGRRLVATSRTGDGAIFDGPSPAGRFGYADGDRGGEMHTVAWLDARRIGTVSEDGALRVWPARGGERLERLALSSEPVRGLAVSTALVAAGGDDGRLALLGPDLDSVADLRIGSPIHDLAFSPDGSRIAVAVADGSVRVLGLR